MVHRHFGAAALIVMILPAVSFAQYGNYWGGWGWGGWGWTTTSAVSAPSGLVADVCTDWDRSWSLYDRICTGDSNPVHSAAPDAPITVPSTSLPDSTILTDEQNVWVTQSVVHGIRAKLESIIVTWSDSLDWIPQRKSRLNEIMLVNQVQIEELPEWYERVQPRVNILLGRLNKLDREERQLKYIRIANTIRNIQQTDLWNNIRVRIILQYIQDRLVLMINI